MESTNGTPTYETSRDVTTEVRAKRSNLIAAVTANLPELSTARNFMQQNWDEGSRSNC